MYCPARDYQYGSVRSSSNLSMAIASTGNGAAAFSSKVKSAASRGMLGAAAAGLRMSAADGITGGGDPLSQQLLANERRLGWSALARRIPGRFRGRANKTVPRMAAADDESAPTTATPPQPTEAPGRPQPKERAGQVVAAANSSVTDQYIPSPAKQEEDEALKELEENDPFIKELKQECDEEEQAA